jgi:hypothetical protein
MLAPIALFAYNRPKHLRQVLDGLRRNPEASLSELYVFSDAPKDAAAAEAVDEVRRLIRGAQGFRAVHVVERERNLGLANSIIAGVGELTERFGTVIVLEDDLLPSPGFLRYLNGALTEYRDDVRVVSAHAYVYPVREALPETFFLRGADCWGWATWVRGWRLFEPDGRRLLESLRAGGLESEFDLDGAYPYMQMLEDQVAGRNDSWAIRWHAAAFLQGLLTLYPGQSQIQNLGADGSGSNVKRTDAFRHEHWGSAVRVGGVPVVESRAARDAFARHLRSAAPTWKQRILGRFSPLLRQ